MYEAVIEIPKNCDRRIHMRFDGSGFEDFGPIKEHIPINEGKMPVAYGYIENAINEVEKDNVDLLVFSASEFKSEEKTLVSIFATLVREDGDHKVLSHDNTIKYDDFSQIEEDLKKLILDYFGYKSKIIKILDKENTERYVNSAMRK